MKKSFKHNRRKAILSTTIMMAGGLALALVIGVVMYSTLFGAFGRDADTLTRDQGLAVRNAIVTAGGIEESLRFIDFSRDYSLKVDSLKVEIEYIGGVLPCKTCLFTFRHFTEGVQDASISGADRICVAKKAAADGSSAQIFVCNANDATCCTIR